MLRFYFLICQSNWYQNASKLIYQLGEISFLSDTQNMVYYKFDFDVWRWTGRWQKSSGRENRPTPGMSFFSKLSVFHFAPTYYTTKKIKKVVERIKILELYIHTFIWDYLDVRLADYSYQTFMSF